MPVPPAEYPRGEPQTLDEIRDWHRGMPVETEQLDPDEVASRADALLRALPR